MRITRAALAVFAGAALLACEPGPKPQSEDAVRAMAREVEADVARVVGLSFKQPPAIALRSREQVHDYLVNKLAEDYSEEELAQVERAYRLFGMLPDTLDLRRLLLQLYAEQIVGYYDPDSTTLYIVQGAAVENVRMTLMHELVHALQDQYVQLDSLLTIEHDNDRRTAAQAVMEGQATLVSVRLLLPNQDVDQMPELWQNYRATVEQQHQAMPVFSSAPRIVREALIFPYLGGADFVRWFNRQFRDTVPFGPRLPTSTEQILHTDRYLAGDQPVGLAFQPSPSIEYDDDLGEFETRIFLTDVTGSETIAHAGAQGWGGDRYAVVATGDGEHVLVWWTVWDDAQAARRFYSILRRRWQARPGRHTSIEQATLAGRPAVRMVDAPEGWQGRLPEVSVR